MIDAQNILFFISVIVLCYFISEMLSPKDNINFFKIPINKNYIIGPHRFSGPSPSRTFRDKHGNQFQGSLF